LFWWYEVIAVQLLAEKSLFFTRIARTVFPETSFFRFPFQFPSPSGARVRDSGPFLVKIGHSPFSLHRFFGLFVSSASTTPDFGGLALILSDWFPSSGRRADPSSLLREGFFSFFPFPSSFSPSTVGYDVDPVLATSGETFFIGAFSSPLTRI